jgi:hypothetical protein
LGKRKPIICGSCRSRKRKTRMISGYLRLERYGFFIIFGLLYPGVLNYILIPIANLILQFLL